MDENYVEQLERAIESQHGGIAQYVQAVPVRDVFQGNVAWEGIVHVFDLAGHSNAARAYAWSHPIEGSDMHRFYAVLQIGAIKSPLDAVRAAIVAEHRNKGAAV